MVLNNTIAQKKLHTSKTKKTSAFILQDYMFFSKSYKGARLYQLGISIEHKIIPRMSISASFFRWGRDDDFNFSLQDWVSIKKYGTIIVTTNCIDCDILVGRKKYQFLDAGANYMLLNFRQYGSFTSALNVSFAWGIDQYLDSNSFDRNVSDVIESSYHEEKHRI